MDQNNSMSAFEAAIETILSNPVDKKTLDGFIQEINLCQGKIRAEREAIKDILNEGKAKLGIKGSMLRKLAKSYEDPTVANEQAEEWESIKVAVEELKS
jgi:hypothetical protein